MRALGVGGLPSFVPARFREPLLRAASRWNVSAALLAAQLMAESNFNPFASSPAGAQGIAQFIPSTAAAYGLANPFDPVEAINAQAHWTWPRSSPGSGSGNRLPSDGRHRV